MVIIASGLVCILRLRVERGVKVLGAYSLRVVRGGLFFCLLGWVFGVEG